MIMEKKDEYDLDHDGVLDERELELAMEKEAKSTWVKMNSLFATHPPTFKRILLLREIEQRDEHWEVHERPSLRSCIASCSKLLKVKAEKIRELNF